MKIASQKWLKIKVLCGSLFSCEIQPAYVDPGNKYRFYDDGSYFLAVLLVKLRDLGFTIQEMLLVMNDESFANLESLVVEKRYTVLQQMEELNSRLKKIEEFLESGRGD